MMPNITVRPYQEKDRSTVEQICIDTAGAGFRETPAQRAPPCRDAPA